MKIERTGERVILDGGHQDDGYSPLVLGCLVRMLKDEWSLSSTMIQNFVFGTVSEKSIPEQLHMFADALEVV